MTNRIVGLALCASLLGGCADAFIFIGITLQCGIMPMGPSDCYPKKKTPPIPSPVQALRPEQGP